MIGPRSDTGNDVVVASKDALVEAKADWPKGVLVIGCGDVRKNGISTLGSRGRREFFWRINVVCKMYFVIWNVFQFIS